MKRYLFLLILLTILCYLNSFGNAFVWDDFNNIVNNASLNEPADLRQIFFNKPAPPLQFYRPIPYYSILLDHFFWGNNPFGYHLTNFLLHLANTILIFFIAIKLTNSKTSAFTPLENHAAYGKGKIKTSPFLTGFICSLLFSLHPVHTEAITYISGRSDPLCAFFLFAAFYCYIKFKRLIIPLILFLLALFSKEAAIVFPLILFSYGLCFLKIPFISGLKKALPFLLLAIAFIFFKYFFIEAGSLKLGWGQFFLLPKILLGYLRLLILPFGLHMQHSFNDHLLISKTPLYILATIYLVLIFIILKRLKSKVSIFALGWFLIGLLPFLGLFKLNADMAEHWLYIGSFGFFLFIAQYRLLRSKVLLSCVVLCLMILTIQRNSIWQNDISIYKDTLNYNPYDYRLHYNLGNAFLRKGRLKDAESSYQASLKIKPDYSYALQNLNIVFMHEAFAGEDLSFDHSLYKVVLEKFVKDGLVKYKDLKTNPAVLDNYLNKLAELNPKALNSFSPNEKIAFYINAYNAITLKAIIQHYPIKSIKDISGAWDRLKFKVAGSNLTLNQIEHEILRKEFKEPRIHFALVCASKGCPKLAEVPFSGEDLDKQLDSGTHKFINDGTKVKLDRNNGVLYISSIFKWFKEDFGDVIKFISEYLPEKTAEFIEKTKLKIRYLNYDWLLNE